MKPELNGGIYESEFEALTNDAPHPKKEREYERNI
jgi:hypothetical protein